MANRNTNHVVNTLVQLGLDQSAKSQSKPSPSSTSDNGDPQPKASGSGKQNSPRKPTVPPGVINMDKLKTILKNPSVTQRIVDIQKANPSAKIIVRTGHLPIAVVRPQNVKALPAPSDKASSSSKSQGILKTLIQEALKSKAQENEAKGRKRKHLKSQSSEDKSLKIKKGKSSDPKATQTQICPVFTGHPHITTFLWIRSFENQYNHHYPFVNGFMYKLRQTQDDKTRYYGCFHESCRLLLAFDLDGNLLRGTGLTQPHNHETHAPLAIRKYAMMQYTTIAEKNLEKRLGMTQREMYNKVGQEIINTFVDGGLSAQDVEPHIPDYECSRGQFKRVAKKSRKGQESSMVEVTEDGDLLVTEKRVQPIGMKKGTSQDFTIDCTSSRTAFDIGYCLLKLMTEDAEGTFGKVLEQLTLLEVGGGKVTASFIVNRTHCDRRGLLHRGMSAAVIEACATIAFLTNKERVDEYAYPGKVLELNINYFNDCARSEDIYVSGSTFTEDQKLAYMSVDLVSRTTQKHIARGSVLISINPEVVSDKERVSSFISQ